MVHGFRSDQVALMQKKGVSKEPNPREGRGPRLKRARTMVTAAGAASSPPSETISVVSSMDVGFAPGGSSSAFDANPRSEEENARDGNRKLSTARNLLMSSFALMSNGTRHTGPRVPLPRSREEHEWGRKLLTGRIGLISGTVHRSIR